MKFRYEKEWKIENEEVIKRNLLRCSLDKILGELNMQQNAFNYPIASPVTIARYGEAIEFTEHALAEISSRTLGLFDRAVLMDVTGGVKRHRAIFNHFYNSSVRRPKVRSLVEALFGMGSYNRLLNLKDEKEARRIDYLTQRIYPMLSREIGDEYTFSVEYNLRKKFAGVREAKRSEAEKINEVVLDYFKRQGLFEGNPGYFLDISLTEDGASFTDPHARVITISSDKIIAYLEKENQKINRALVLPVIAHEVRHWTQMEYARKFFPPGLDGDGRTDNYEIQGVHLEGVAMDAEFEFLKDTHSLMDFTSEELSLANLYARTYLALRGDFILMAIADSENWLERRSKRNNGKTVSDFEERVAKLAGVKRYDIDHNVTQADISDVLWLATYSQGQRAIHRISHELQISGISDDLRLTALSAGIWSDMGAFKYFVRNCFIPEFTKK